VLYTQYFVYHSHASRKYLYQQSSTLAKFSSAFSALGTSAAGRFNVWRCNHKWLA
jgi:hypothetical protein